MAHNSPPNDFREISIFPEPRELLSHGQPFLRENVISGKYDGVESYLDIHFRLLRENFIRPWRENIANYRRSLSPFYDEYVDEDDPENDGKINFYRNVRSLGGNAAFHKFQFDCEHLRKSEWENDERLKIDSLVCLSSNDFATIDYIATVAGSRYLPRTVRNKNTDTDTDTDTETEIEKGTIGLTFEFNTKVKFPKNKTFVMLEAPESFEVYRYHLRELQNFSKTNFPLTKYIINVDKSVSAPSYLSGNKEYQLSNGLADSDPLSKSINVQILNENCWPSGVHQRLGLNESQCMAFRAALTKQLAIIQAPPGTGKIYIGLRIVEALLANGCPLPILIICSSNYTLDRFLAGVLKFCSAQEIVRDSDGYTGAKLIGMTTTKAAKNKNIIDRWQPKIALVEEAALVFESEIVSALTAITQHLILIGDHNQLRPRNADFRLAKDFHLNISLFERFIRNGMQYYQLKEQRRMRPCMSTLLVPHVYKQLLDHPSVEEYTNVKGLCKNMFFVNHEHFEEVNKHINLHEASFIVALCKYLIQQGYKTKQVTILTTYKAQLMKIKGLLHGDSMLKKIHAVSVDSFQGEANDIVLVSFVRSNATNDIGFLKTLKRITVALSRANKGLYCIGNFDSMAIARGVYRCHFPWNELVRSLKRQNAIGNALELCCQIHGIKCTVKTAGDFWMKVPDGGCIGMQKKSGHICMRFCDFGMNDMLRRMWQHKVCNQTCNRTCSRGHRCEKKCHYPDPCQCAVQFEELRPECGHLVKIACWQNPSSVFCFKQVQTKSPCGHTVTIHCSDSKNVSKLLQACVKPCSVQPKCQPGHPCPDSCHYPNPCRKCAIQVDKVLPKCQHIVRMSCSDNPAMVYCTNICEKNRSCGHKCSGVCGALCKSVFCNEIIRAKSPCRHTVTIKCSDSNTTHKLLAACVERCNVQPICLPGHLCLAYCHYPKPCLKCVIKVDKLLPGCLHTVRMSCSDNSSTVYCAKPCEKIRRCGHKCKDKCGANCEDKICTEQTQVKSPCGHTVTIKCCDSKSDLKLLKACTEPCNVELKCGHLCKGTCVRCKHGRLHMSCEENCTKLLASGIPCRNKCSDFCEDIYGCGCMWMWNPTSFLAKQMTDCTLKGKNANANLPTFLRTVYASLRTQLNRNSSRSTHELIKKKKKLLEPIRRVSLSVYNKPTVSEKCSRSILLRFDERMQTAAHFIENYKECAQQRDDITAEIAILKLMANAIVKASALTLDETGKKLLNDAFELVNPGRRVTETTPNIFGRQLLEAYKHTSNNESECSIM